MNKSTARQNLVRQSEELVLKKEMIDMAASHEELPRIPLRSHSMDDNTFVEAQPILTTGWFDTNDDFEAHRRLVKTKMNMSLKEDGRYDESQNRRKLYQTYKHMGGSKGSVLFAGTSAFDVSSNGALADLMSSYDGGEKALLSDHDDNDDRRTKTQRYFSKMEKGSMRGSILGMTCAAIGSGVLTFPAVFK